MLKVLRQIAAFFPLGPAKAEENLLKLKDMKDNKIFKSLEGLTAADVSLEEALKLTKVCFKFASG